MSLRMDSPNNCRFTLYPGRNQRRQHKQLWYLLYRLIEWNKMFQWFITLNPRSSKHYPTLQGASWTFSPAASRSGASRPAKTSIFAWPLVYLLLTSTTWIDVNDTHVTYNIVYAVLYKLQVYGIYMNLLWNYELWITNNIYLLQWFGMCTLLTARLLLRTSLVVVGSLFSLPMGCLQLKRQPITK